MEDHKIRCILHEFFENSLSHQYDNKKKVLSKLYETGCTPLIETFKNLEILQRMSKICVCQSKLQTIITKHHL